MSLFQIARSAAINILGEQNYRKFAKAVLATGVGRNLAQRNFIEVGPTTEQVPWLHLQEVATTLSLGIQYSYNSFIDGDIVEFGTASGFTARAIARAMIVAEAARPPKRLHLFDSFIGLPEATSEVDRNSYEVKAGIWSPGSCRVLSKDELFRSCSEIIPPERIAMHEGWFKDTVAKLSPSQRFAFIHFDGDMYQSTIDAIGGLLAMGAISNGAMICFDDWNCSQADPNCGERRAWKELAEKYDVIFSDWRAYSTMGRAFFIHDYRRG